MAQVISEPQQILPQVIPEILEEGENVSLNLDCSTLSQPDRDLKRFIMESLDVESQETLDDLKTPSCRAAFDMACEFLPREKMAQLLKNPEGLNILRAGHCLRSFSDFVDFDLSTFALFPDLKISEIQHWETIKPEVLLGLISSVDYASIGRIELFPERVGMNPLSHKAWIEHPTIWQLFLIEGVINLPPAHKQEFANFMADSRKLERLIQGPSTASSEPQVSPRKNWITSGKKPKFSLVLLILFYLFYFCRL